MYVTLPTSGLSMLCKYLIVYVWCFFKKMRIIISHLRGLKSPCVTFDMLGFSVVFQPLWKGLWHTSKLSSSQPPQWNVPGRTIGFEDTWWENVNCCLARVRTLSGNRRVIGAYRRNIITGLLTVLWRELWRLKAFTRTTSASCHTTFFTKNV